MTATQLYVVPRSIPIMGSLGWSAVSVGDLVWVALARGRRASGQRMMRRNRTTPKPMDEGEKGRRRWGWGWGFLRDIFRDMLVEFSSLSRCCRFLLFVLGVRSLEWKEVLERCCRWRLEVCPMDVDGNVLCSQSLGLSSSTTISGMNHNRQSTRKIAWLWHERTDTLFTRPLGPRVHPHRLTAMQEDTFPPRLQAMRFPATARETVPDPSPS